jgi:DNA-binding NtrC family response regulator
MDVAFELVISPGGGALPLRLPLAKRFTTIGSDRAADFRLATAPPQWLAIERSDRGVVIRELATSTARELEPGDAVDIDGATLSLAIGVSDAAQSAAIETLVSQLSGAVSPGRALDLILEGVMAAAGADTGAVILSEGGAYRVACARDADGRVLQGAAELLSDTIVRDVLGSGERICLTNVALHDRYARVPSVTSMRLRSVICLPLGAEGRTLGAVFLGKQARRVPFSERVAAELRMLTAMALPFLAQLRGRGATRPDELLGESPAIDRVRELVARVGPTDLSVLIVGESGTGKELVARAIHRESSRGGKEMIAINCAAVPESLLAGELFGYRKGAFTGAAADRAGLVEAAGGSTLFLDEIGDMPPPMQASLLRVLEQREVTRLGENQPRAVDFRLIAATHRDLDAEVEAGRFRQDLLFRLRELAIEVPPLRDRGGDVELLARFFLRQAETRLALPMHRLGADAIEALASHPFPGNVRELRATMRRAAILADRVVVSAADLGLAAPRRSLAELGDLDRPLAAARDEFVRRYVTAVLERYGGDREKAAAELEIGVRTLYRHLS